MKRALQSGWSILLQSVQGVARFLIVASLMAPASRAIVDVNNNGMSDLWEKQYHNSSLFDTSFVAQDDLDGDGWTNGKEAVTGTNPKDGKPPAGFLTPLLTYHPPVWVDTDNDGIADSQTAVSASVTWPSLIGKQYQLLGSPDLMPGTWLEVDEPRMGTGGEIGLGIPLTQPDGSIPERLFWRVAVTDVDTDGDGLTDHEENQTGSNPEISDTDDDGLSDKEEAELETDPNDPDSDDDGATDGDEVEQHADPKDSNDFPVRMLCMARGVLGGDSEDEIPEIQTSAHTVYRILKDGDLDDFGWQEYDTPHLLSRMLTDLEALVYPEFPDPASSRISVSKDLVTSANYFNQVINDANWNQFEDNEVEIGQRGVWIEAPPAAEERKRSFLKVSESSIYVDDTTNVDPETGEFMVMEKDSRCEFVTITTAPNNRYSERCDLSFPVDMVVEELGSSGVQEITTMLVPLDFANPRGSIHELQISDSAPRVVLDDLTNSSVSVTGSQASVQISGAVFDPITALLPPGTADLTSLRVYLNGTKLATTGNLQRQSADQGLWKPYGDEFTISPFTVSFPAGGTNFIRIETPPNAAGMVGKAEFEVNFRTDVTPRPSIPAFIIEQDIILSGALNPEAEDTVQLAAVNEAPSLTLTETDDDTGVFVSAQGHAFVMSKTFTATASADPLPCSLMLPGSPMSFSLRGQSGQCVETGPETLRFRYTETIPGRPQDSTLTEVLDNVQMHPIPKEQDGWFPITLKMGAELAGLKLKWFGKEFPIKPTSGGICATTQDDKPLVGVVVKRSEEPADPEQDPPPPVLEFMYYDHEAGSIVRVPLDENLGTHEWKLMQDGRELHTDELPLKQIAFVNSDGSLANGILPLPIETLQAILEGDTPEIGSEQYAFIELRGHIDGEVVRFGNEEAPYDYYDLIAGEEETLLQEGPRHVRLEKIADRKFRSAQKVVIYGTSDTSSQELTQSQWLALRDAGYLAIHNADKKVFWGKEDIEWLTSERGSFQPPDGTKMGLPGANDPSKVAFYQFEGYDDHHIFNKYHAKWDANAKKWIANGKALAWDKLFEGEGFDVDEFTVPVRKKVHSKIGHLSNKGWESFLSEVFDETTGELKPSITGKVLAQKRGEAFALMEEMVKEMGLELKWARPYPKGVFASRTLKPELYNQLVDSRGQLGESLSRLGFMSNKYLKALGSNATEAGKDLFKKHVKRFLKTGGKRVIKCLPLAFSYQTHADTHRMLLDVMSFGPKEGAARHLDYSLELQDLPLARIIVDQNWEKFEDLLAGADGNLCAQLPTGTAIKVGDPSFICDFDDSGKIVHITPYVITNIWKFPNGRVKVKAKMTRNPYTTIVEEDTKWYITDWYPAIGETKADWQEACQRAGAFNNYGLP